MSMVSKVESLTLAHSFVSGMSFNEHTEGSYHHKLFAEGQENLACKTHGIPTCNILESLSTLNFCSVDPRKPLDMSVEQILGILSVEQIPGASLSDVLLSWWHTLAENFAHVTGLHEAHERILSAAGSDTEPPMWKPWSSRTADGKLHRTFYWPYVTLECWPTN